MRDKASLKVHKDNSSFFLEFQDYDESIPETDGWMTETITHLAPSTKYDVRLRATNQRPQMPNHSEYVSVETRTKGKNKCKVIRIYLLKISKAFLLYEKVVFCV